MALHEWTVAGGLIETDAGVLLVRNVRRGGFEDWSTPGGVIDADDADLLAGLTREVAEETGLSCGSGSVRSTRCARTRPTWVGACVARCISRSAFEGELRVDDPDGIVVEARFVPPHECDEHLRLVRAVGAGAVERVVARALGAASRARASTTRSTARRAIRCEWYAVPRPEPRRPDGTHSDATASTPRSCTSISTRSTRRSSSSTIRRCAAGP